MWPPRTIRLACVVAQHRASAMDDLEVLEAAISGPSVKREPSPSPAGEGWVPCASSASSASGPSAAQGSHGTPAKRRRRGLAFLSPKTEEVQPSPCKAEDSQGGSDGVVFCSVNASDDNVKPCLNMPNRTCN